MDVLNLNPVQSSASAISGIAMDAAPADDAAAGIDFSALLALGLNSCAPDAPQSQALEDIKAEAAMVADTPAAAPELLIALPQAMPNADAPAGDATPNGPQSAAAAAQTAKPAQAPLAMGSFESTRAAVVADDPANIAAASAQATPHTQSEGRIQNADQRTERAASPHSDQDIALDELRANSGDTLRTNPGDAPPRTEPLPHALQIHPAETRAPLSQPSALLEVQAPVSEPGFAQALSRQVVWMVDKDAQVAELRINPPELGPVEVRLTLNQDSAAAEFVSPHAEVRAAIESSIARLREAMAEAGIQLGEASVSAESFSQRADAQADSRRSRGGYREPSFAEHGDARANETAVTLTRGLVDVFA